MFSLIVAFVIYLIQVGYSHYPWNAALVSAAKFVFYWNLIFGSITIFFFLLMLVGLTTILFKVPFIGVGIYRFHEKIRQLGMVTFLFRTSFLWVLSRSFILIGSYFLAFEMSDRTDLLVASLALVVAGYLIKKQTAKDSGTRIHHHFSVQNFDPRTPKEKDITPAEPISIAEERK